MSTMDEFRDTFDENKKSSKKSNKDKDDTKTMDKAESKSKAKEADLKDLVLMKLGTPDNFSHIDMKNVWGNHYRVNVWLASERYTKQISDTYFMTVVEGKIIKSNPELKAKYKIRPRVAVEKVELANKPAFDPTKGVSKVADEIPRVEQVNE